jgi:putative flippase GtrA
MSQTESLPISTPQSNGIIQKISVRIGGSKAKEVERFLKFIVVGIIGLAIDLTITNIMRKTLFKPQQDTNLPDMIANGLGFTSAVISNFIINRYWTYPDSRSRSILRQLGQFFIINIVGLAIREVILTYILSVPMISLVKQVLGTGLAASDEKDIGYNIALMMTILIVMLWNFFANRYWTYNDVQ